MLFGLFDNLRRFASVNWLQSFRVNLYYFPLKRAIKLPILFGYGVKIGSLGNRRAVQIDSKFAQFCFCLKSDPFNMGYRNSYWNLERNAIVTFKGTCRLSKGTIINVFNGGHLSFGDKFTGNANLLLSCASHIEFGDDNLLGWNITIMDNDGGHLVVSKDGEKQLNSPSPIIIGDHVWIAAETSILKSTQIPANSIIGFRSILCGFKHAEQNVVIAGSTPHIVKNDINWLH